MKPKRANHGRRFRAAILSQADRWYSRFQPSLRDIEELLFERGVIVSHETIRRRCDKFGAAFAHRLKVARGKAGSTWLLDEMFLNLRADFARVFPTASGRPIQPAGHRSTARVFCAS